MTVLSSNYASTTDGVIQGLLYVPDIKDDDPCRAALDAFLPKKVVRHADLPPANYNIIAIAPWINATCTQSYLASARLDPLRAFIFYRPSNVSSDPPPADSPEWDLGDRGRWKTQNRFPILAVSGLAGQELMHQAGLYSGNLSDVPYARNITSVYEADPSDYVRIWTQIYVSTSSNAPSIWVLVLVILGVLVGVIGSTSLLMHFLQGRRRASLRRRVQSGDVNLEGMGIKRLTVPIAHVQTFPLFTYNYEPKANSAPTSPTSSKHPQNARKKGSRGRPSSIATTTLPISEKGLDSPFALSTTATDYQPMCAICLEAYQNRVTVIRELPCGHIFHPDCIDEFLAENSSLCPVCKACILPKGYCPKITNAMVRRERAIRRLRDRIEVDDDVEADSTGGRFHNWGDEIKKRLSLFKPSGPASSSNPTEPQPQPQPRRRSTAPEVTSVHHQECNSSSSNSRADLMRKRMRQLAGSEPDDEDARLTRCTSIMETGRKTSDSERCC